ncbi:MAG: VacJ family lipoprotein [Elusimicrobia bacterium]|nr:VacJ family lipoprotein [Elusimicrobiota bacterium]
MTILLLLLLAFPGAARAQDAAPDDDFASFGEEFKTEAPRPDPLRHWNRAFFHVNDKFYFWLAKPVSRAYGHVVPRPARMAVDRGFDNMRWPVRFVGCLLQLKMGRAGQETRRFLVNSTLGLGGLFDPADRWFGWQAPPSEDLGQALGRWGVGEGFPFTIPILGPSNLRDGLMIVPSMFMSPVPYVADLPVSMGVASGEQMNYISLHVGEYESLKKDALDPYTFVRDAYHKSREKKIKE